MAGGHSRFYTTERWDNQLTATISANIETAGTYLNHLEHLQIPVVAMEDGHIEHRLFGIAYQPEAACYLAGIVTEKGRALLPLTGRTTLEIGRSKPMQRRWSAARKYTGISAVGRRQHSSVKHPA